MRKLARTLGRWSAVLEITLAWSCTSDVSPPAIAPVAALAPLTATVRELPELPFEALGVTGRDAGYSARFGDVSAWVFGDTFSRKAPPDGSVLSSTWSWTRDWSAADGAIAPFEQSPDPADPADPSGAAKQLIPYDAAGYERAFNMLHACPAGTSGPKCPCPAADDRCGDRFALWPGPVITYRDNANATRGLVLYTELIVHPVDTFSYTIRGTSIARWDDPRQPVVRTFPTIFGAEDPQMTAGAVQFTSAATEYLYVYACEPHAGTLQATCRVGRAPFLRGCGADVLASILRRADWKFFTGGDPDAVENWSATAADGVTVMTASTTLSVQSNAYLGALTSVYAQFATNDVYLQTAARPEGPWSGHTAPLFDVGEVQNGRFDYYAIVHSEYDAAAASGKLGETIYLTTAHPDPNDAFRMPMRLFEVTLH
jgi:hypothetical protein